MKTVFADTVYWIAITRPNDSWAAPAKRARLEVGDARILTTDEVLTEFLTVLGNYGQAIREQAAKMVRAILANPNVKVLPQSRDSFLRGLHLYEKRLDKTYSLTDCISMQAMRAESVSEVLTSDHHFEQDGFQALMSKNQ